VFPSSAAACPLSDHAPNGAAPRRQARRPLLSEILNPTPVRIFRAPPHRSPLRQVRHGARSFARPRDQKPACPSDAPSRSVRARTGFAPEVRHVRVDRSTGRRPSSSRRLRTNEVRVRTSLCRPSALGVGGGTTRESDRFSHWAPSLINRCQAGNPARTGAGFHGPRKTSALCPDRIGSRGTATPHLRRSRPAAEMRPIHLGRHSLPSHGREKRKIKPPLVGTEYARRLRGPTLKRVAPHWPERADGRPDANYLCADASSGRALT